jgi:hypothetical protein
MPLQAEAVGGGGGEADEVTCKYCALEMLLGVPGLLTVIAKEPVVVAAPVTVNCVAETNVVDRGEPANSTCEPATKPPPVTVIAKLPTGTEEGESAASRGAELELELELELEDEEEFELLPDDGSDAV